MTNDRNLLYTAHLSDLNKKWQPMTSQNLEAHMPYRLLYRYL